MDSVCEDLGIPKQHVQKVTGCIDRFLVVADKSWLKCLDEQKKLKEFPVFKGLDQRALCDLGYQWTRVYFQIYKKYNHKVVPLPRSRLEDTNELPLTFAQILTFVSSTNYRQLWKESWRKYAEPHAKWNKQANDQKIGSAFDLIPYDIVLKELIQRMFACCIIHSKLDRIKSPAEHQFPVIHSDLHANCLPALIAVETSSHISVIFYPPTIDTSLYACITYSPAILSKSHNKPLFILYQILQFTKHLHNEGLMIGDLTLHDIYLKENLWLQIIPNLESNISRLDADDTPTEPTDGFTESAKFDLKFAYDLHQFSLREYCEMWCNGQLSNFDYLTILNNLSGRRIGSPEYHHIMPWVTDFASRNGQNWRDLSKSKYRINKGDPHLDFMFTPTTGNEVPHHVSDFLSEITYFVYMARRTPQHILCQHVRPIWVPAEYPASIQRLQEWTPDECIPEFFSDPMVFKSIHEDLPDLEPPTWASCPEDFIAKHREALESQHVSERLHMWIDLNFGYKLAGQAAVKSKNVCLPLVDNHRNLCKRGIVQLFTHPHPPKRTNSIWFNRTPPRISSSSAEHHRRRMTRSSEDLSGTRSSSRHNNDSDYQSPGRKYNTSPKSVHRRTTNPNIPEGEAITGTNIERSTSYHTNVQQQRSPNTIVLPKDYNPSAQITLLENMQTFFAKTFLNQKSLTARTAEKLAVNDLMFEETSENSYTNRFFSEAFEASLMKDEKRLRNLRHKNLIVQNSTRNFKQIVAEKRKRELQVIGCLMVEIFLLDKVRPLSVDNNENRQSFESRLTACQAVARAHMSAIPKNVQYAIKLLLAIDDTGKTPVGITDLGFPEPTAHQILQPIFSNSIIPFPTNYHRVYTFVTCLKDFEFTSHLLDLNTYFHCDGTKCSQYNDLDRKRVIFSRKIAECKLKGGCLHLEGLLDPIGYEQFNPVELLLPHIIDLLRTEDTSILTAWYLFDTVAAALGVRETQKLLLEPMLRLYSDENDERAQFLAKRTFDSSMRFTMSSTFKSRKSVKLYHHSFLLRLIVRFGLKCFLDNFVSPLIEAVGGYKEPEESTGFHCHGRNVNQFSEQRRRSRSDRNFRICCNEESDNSLTLISPDHSDLKSDNTPILDQSMRQEIEELFTFEADDGTLSEKQKEFEITKSMESLELQLNHSNAEEAMEEDDGFSPEKLAIHDIIYGGSKFSNNSFEDDKISVNSGRTSVDSPQKSTENPTTSDPKSPTIPIPATFRRTYELSSIDCEVGSKKSIDSFDFLAHGDSRNQSKESQAEKINRQEDEDDSTQASFVSAVSVQGSTPSKMYEIQNSRNNRIGEMSMESLVWLAHRLGPVLTARYLSRNLLKMLTLCYIGQENLLPVSTGEMEADKSNDPVCEKTLDLFTVSDSIVVGDYNAARVLQCLIAIAGLFGEQFILFQYFPHISELVALCKKRITTSLEGALISSLQLMKNIIPCLLDTTIMNQLQDMFLSNILHPIIRLVGSSQFTMPSGYLGRNVLARKLVDTIYVLSIRIGPEMSKDRLCIPALQRYFLIFDKAYGIQENFDTSSKQNPESQTSALADDSNFIEIQRDGGVKEWNIRGSKIQQVKVNIERDTGENISPPLTETGKENMESHIRERGLDEIRDVFTPSLAHCSYLAFLQFLGDAIMSKTIFNMNLVLTLCHEFEQPDYDSTVGSDHNKRSNYGPQSTLSVSGGFGDDSSGLSNSFGSAVIGNRIEITRPHPKQDSIGPMEVLDMVAYKMEQMNTSRHLRGNWLAYWEHEIGRPDKDTHLNLKHIKLQTFAGHSNSVRSILSLDNENSFMSGSKDKTVKLWSLRSEGDGAKVTSSQFTYTYHKKSVHSLAFLESLRYVVSCDSGVHIWDPFIGRALVVLDSHTKYSPVSVVRTYPSPSPLILAGTAESTVKIIDARTCTYVNEWKVTSTQNNTVRCLACGPSGHWVAVGLSSGIIVIMEGRSGMVLNSWKATDGELLQLVAPNDYQIVSSSLDHSISVWNINGANLQYHLRQPPEPAHCLLTNGNELIFATPANRIGVYSNLSTTDGTYSLTKLRSESSRSVLTSLAVLPLNKMLLTGNDSGNIVLLC